MIPRRYITEWKANAPWPTDAQVEQDLVIERALVALFSDPFLKEHVAFRGGTALHEIYMTRLARHAEDVHLVQIKKSPLQPILQAIAKQLDFLGTKRNIKQNVNIDPATYRSESEIPRVVNMRLKIES